MEHTRDHIIFFMAQKMYFLEKRGSREVFNRLVEHFEQINLDGLLEYLTRYYAADVERELDDFYLAEGELVFISRRKKVRFKHVYRDGRLRLVGIEIDRDDTEAAGSWPAFPPALLLHDRRNLVPEAAGHGAGVHVPGWILWHSLRYAFDSSSTSLRTTCRPS